MHKITIGINEDIILEVYISKALGNMPYGELRELIAQHLIGGDSDE